MIFTSSQHQVLIVLDRQVALESLVLNRLQKIPDCRQQEWLRGLLLDGFRLACNALRAAQCSSGGPSLKGEIKQKPLELPEAITSPATSLGVGSSQTESFKQQSLPHKAGTPVEGENKKPFSQLKKVIG